MSTRADILFEDDPPEIKTYYPLIYVWGDGTPQCVERLLYLTKIVSENTTGYAGAIGAISNLLFIHRLWSMQVQLRDEKEVRDAFLGHDIFQFLGRDIFDLKKFSINSVFRFNTHIFPLNKNDIDNLKQERWNGFGEAHYFFYVKIKTFRDTNKEQWHVKVARTYDNKVLFDGDIEDLHRKREEWEESDTDESFDDYLLPH